MTTEWKRWICVAWLLLIPLSGNAATPSVAAGANHTIALKNNGTVVAWGSDSSGQLGLGRSLQSTTPVQAVGLGQVLAIKTGGSHTVALRQDGTVWAWGDNLFGQLGDGTTTGRSTPAQVPGLSGVAAIAAGFWHTVALRQDGTVWAWGANLFGQLGDGTTTDRSTPVPVMGLTRVAAIAPGYGYTLALKQDGTVWAWGAGYVNPGTSTPAQVSGLTGFIAIATGVYHSFALKQDGTVWAWGDNRFGQLGDGTVADQYTPVLVVNETVNNFLDLIPESPNSIPPDKIPPFFLATYKTGDLSATTLYADVRGITPIGSFASAKGVGPLIDGGYNVYVAAIVPYSGSYVYYQLDSSNVWSVLTWPMADFMRGVALGSQDALIRVNILQNVDVSPYIGTSILIGYGTDPDEMMANARYRTIFTVTQQQ